MEEVDLKELILVFWSRRVEIILIMILAIILGGFYSYYYVTPEYKASTTLVLAQNSPKTTETNVEGAITQTDIIVNSKLVSTYSEIIKSKAVLREVANSLNISGLTEQKLKRCISVQSVKDTEVIEIVVRDTDAEIASRIANKTAEVFSKKVVEIYNISNVYILDKAEPSDVPYNINHVKDICIFAIIGLIIAFAMVLMINLLDTTIKTEQDIENMDLLVLSSIPTYDIQQKNNGRRLN